VSATSLDPVGAPRRVPGWLWRISLHPWGAWALTRGLVLVFGGLTALIHRGNVFYDTTYYATWAQGTLDGSAVPYRDFPWEYPPGALPGMLLPGLVSPLFDARPSNPYLVLYAVLWVAMLLAIDAFVLRLVLRRTGGGAEGAHHPATVLWIYGLPLLGSLSWARIDMIPAAIAFAAVLLAESSKPVRSGIWAGLGATVKLWPALLAPIQRTRPRALVAVATTGAVVLAYAGATFWATGSTGFSQVVHYQSERGLQIESIVGLPLVWLHHLGVDGYTTSFDFGAWQIDGPGATLLAKAVTAAFALAIVVVLGLHWRFMRIDARPRGVGLTAVAMLLLVLVTNKVFSPQYVLWLLAVVTAAAVLDPQTWRPFVPRLLWLAALTQLVFPLFYGDIVFGAWFGLLLMTARDVLLLVVTVQVVRALWRNLVDVRRQESGSTDTSRPFQLS
jgi:hypothetical protein